MDSYKKYGNLGDDEHGLQKMANDAARSSVLKEFAAEMDLHDSRRISSTQSPLNNLRVAPKQDAPEHLLPLDFDERLEKYMRD